MRVLLIVCSLIVGMAAAQARVPGDLYEVEVPVQSQAVAERNTALAAALGEVLVKSSGTRSILEHERARDALAQPGRYVQQYRYLAPARGESGQRLWVRFDASGLDALVAGAGVAGWPFPRSSTLVWLAVDGRQGRTLLSAADVQHEARQLLDQRARERAVPLLFPLMDLTDQAQVRLGDLWGGFHEPVLAASQRYDAGAVLTGRVAADGAEWSGRWQLFHAGEPLAQWESRGTLQEVLHAGMDRSGDMLAQHYGLSAGQEGALRVQVREVGSLEDYRRALSQIESLGVVDGVLVERVDADQVVFRVDARGGRAGLTRALRGNGVLVAAGNAGAAGDELVYRLVR